MRLGSTLMVAGLALLAATSAHAQTGYQTVTPSGGYVYNGANGTGSTYTAPIYNQNARPLPMQQMIKGKNAPSYNFKGSGSQGYNFGTTGTKSGPMSIEEATRNRDLRDAQANQEAKEYLAMQAQQNALNAQNGAAGNPLYQLLPGQQQQQPARKKRLVSREDSNPLRTPPRLFNPDQ